MFNRILLIKNNLNAAAAKLWILGLLSLFSITAVSQTVAYYGFSQSQGTYSALENPTNIVTAMAASGDAGIDEQVYTLDNVIPFNFAFNGANYSSIKVYANGFISFGADTNSTSDPLSSSSYSGVISPFGADLDALYNIAGNTGSISYAVTGTAPEREFVVEWRHFRPYSFNSATATNHHNWNFQARLKEDGTIRFVYDFTFTGAPSSTNGKVGLRGTTSSDYINRTASGNAASNWSNTVPGTYSSTGIATNYSYLPAQGLTFTWTPPSACVAPAAQPTNLVLTNTGIIINASFTAATPAADRYLVLRNIAGTTPNLPVNGTTYSTGQNESLNSYVAYYGTGTSFENNYNHGIRGNNQYTYTVYSVTSNCTGGPLYYTNQPLTGTITNCPATVNGITASAINSNSFSLSWPATENGNALPFTTVLEVATNNTFTNMVQGSPFTLTSATLSQAINGLQPNTQYFFRAKNISSLCESSYSNIGNVYTACVPVSEFTEGFDNVTGNALPNCWTKILTGSDYTPTINVTTTDAFSAPNNVSFYGNGADTDAASTKMILVSPEVNSLAAGTHRLRFKARKTSSTSAAGLRVVALDGNTATANITVIQSVTELSTTYQEFTVYFNDYSGNANYIGIQRVGGPSYSYVYIDDVVFEETPSCFELQGVTAGNVTPSSATVNWTNINNEAPAGGYEYFVSTTNTVPAETQTFIQTTEATANITDLNSGTAYYVFVRRICADDDKSAWKSVSFTTINTAPAPWNEQFPTSTYPAGWNTTNWSLGTVRGASGNGSSAMNLYKNLYSGATTATFTTIAVGPLNADNYELSFYHKQSNYNSPYGVPSNWGNFTVQISTDFGTTWTTIATVSNETAEGYNQKVYSLEDYEGEYVQVKVVATWNSGDFDLSFDNFEIKAPQVAVETVTVAVAEDAEPVINEENGTLQLIATVAPENATNADVTWSIVSGSEFATVSDDGLVTATANGVVTVRATSVSDTTKFDEIEVTVEIAEDYCTPSATIAVLTTNVQFADINNNSSTTANVTYEDFTAVSSDVNKNQTYTLTAQSAGFLSLTDFLYLQVYIDWNQDNVFDESEFYLSTAPEVFSKDITVPSSALTGTTRMRVIIKDVTTFGPCANSLYGQTEDYTLNVLEDTSVAVTSVTVSTQNNVPGTITTENGTLQLVAVVTPEDATNADVTWSIVSGSEFATVSEDGLVTAMANGVVTVRATSVSDATKFDEIEITIAYETVVAVETVTVSVAEDAEPVINVENGTLQLVAVVTPEDATNADVTWSIVSGNEFATVSEDGLVTAMANGVVTVRATSVSDATKFDEIEITIAYETVVAVETVTVSVAEDAEPVINVENGTLQLVAVVTPEDATNADVTWSIVSGSEFATVSEDGLVTAVANGVVTVRATSVSDATKFDEIEVTIDVTAGVPDFSKDGIALYPNPVTDVINVVSVMPAKQIIVYNQLGQLVTTVSNATTADLSSAAAGVYIVKVVLENGVSVTQKIIKK